MTMSGEAVGTNLQARDSGGNARIVVVDLETTGLPPPAEVIEFGRCALYAGRDLWGVPVWSEAAVGGAQATLLRPLRGVPPETSAVHHLVDDDLRDAPTWEHVARTLAAAAAEGPATAAIAFAAHSAGFERQWLTPEAGFGLPWICTYKCALRAWPEAPGHSNQTLRYWRNPAGLERAAAVPPHRAGPDAYVTAFLLRELLREHPVETLIAWSGEPAVLIRVPFGKRPEEGGNRGVRWTEVDDGFLWWVRERDFSEDILHTVRAELLRREVAALAEQGGEEGTASC